MKVCPECDCMYWYVEYEERNAQGTLICANPVCNTHFPTNRIDDLYELEDMEDSA